MRSMPQQHWPELVEGAIDKVGHGVVHLDVWQHIGRVLAAEFQAERGKGAGCGLLDCPPARNGASEVDVVDLAGAKQGLGLAVRLSTNVLEQALRQPGLVEGGLETFADKQCLGGVFQDHGIAGHQRGNDRVDRSQIRVVPRRDDHDEADRNTAQVAAEAILVIGRRRHRRARWRPIPPL